MYFNVVPSLFLFALHKYFSGFDLMVDWGRTWEVMTRRCCGIWLSRR